LILKQVTGFMRLLVVNPADENAKRSNKNEDGDLKIDRSLSPRPQTQAEGKSSFSNGHFIT
jgi:hypothetical protein